MKSFGPVIFINFEVSELLIMVKKNTSSANLKCKKSRRNNHHLISWEGERKKSEAIRAGSRVCRARIDPQLLDSRLNLTRLSSPPAHSTEKRLKWAQKCARACTVCTQKYLPRLFLFFLVTYRLFFDNWQHSFENVRLQN